MDDARGRKHELRRRLRAARDGLGDASGPALAERVQALAPVREARTVTAYVSIGDEPATGPLLDRLRAADVRVLLPVLTDDLDLDWAVHDGDLAPGRYPRLLEPTGPRLGRDAVSAADVLLVPGQAVDPDGTRLGQGGGCYDKAMARTDALRVLLVHDHEVLDQPLPCEPHDLPVDLVVTPTRVLGISPRGRDAARRSPPPAPPPG